MNIENANISHEVYVKANIKEIYDFDRFQKIQRNIIDELGCTACTSGVNLRFDIESYFNDKQFDSTLKDVRVVAPRAIADKFETNVKARQAVLRELGCEPCTSGYNIIFEDELAYAVNDAAEVVNLIR